MKHKLFLVLVLFSCSPSEKHLFSFETDSLHSFQVFFPESIFPMPNDEKLIINIKDYKSFGDFRKALNDSICRDSKEAYLQLEIDYKKLTIPLISPICDYGIFDWKDRNRLNIKSNGDIKVLKKFLLNYDKDINYSEYPTRAFLFIDLTDEEKIETFERVFIGIIQSYSVIIDEQCQQVYNKSFKECSEVELNAVLKDIPLRVKTRETENGFL